MRGGEYGFRSDGGGGDVARPVKFMGQPPDPSMNVFDDRFADGVEMMQPAGVLKMVSVDPRRDVGGERQLPGETIVVENLDVEAVFQQLAAHRRARKRLDPDR